MMKFTAEREDGRTPIDVDPSSTHGSMLLDVPEVARRLACGKSFVYMLIDRGELPAIKLGRLTRVIDTQLESFIATLAMGR